MIMRNYKWLIMLMLVVICGVSCGRTEDKVCFESVCVNVEIVQTPEERERGLQQRESLAPHAGMLFIFTQSGRHGFWMKETLIPLDMLWINERQEVVHIQNNAVPCPDGRCEIYSPPRKALYVLEVNAGFAEKYGIKPGARADFQIRPQ